jgi:hypothetical protein
MAANATSHQSFMISLLFFAAWNELGRGKEVPGDKTKMPRPFKANGWLCAETQKARYQERV